jgi:phosphomannomutase
MKWQDGLIVGKVINEFTFRKLHQIMGVMSHSWMRQERAQSSAVIGFDTRYQSDLSARICAEVLAAKGVRVYLARDSLPLGALLLALSRKQAYGIMVAGGERAVEYNGLRLMQANGLELTQSEWDTWKERISDFEFLEELDFEQAVSDGMIHFPPLLDEYIAFLRETVDCEQIKESRIKIVFDSQYGSAQGVMMRLLFSEGGEIEEIHKARHSMFGGLTPELGEQNIMNLHCTCQVKHKHLGFLYDSEAHNWAYIHAKSGNVKHGRQILPFIEKYAANKGVSSRFPHWRKDGILCSLLYLEVLIQG